MNSSPAELTRRELLGFAAHPGSLDAYLDFLNARIGTREKCTILYHNLHSLYAYFTDAALRRDYAGCTVLVDGMPVIWLMRALGLPVTRDDRLTYVDFIMPMMRLARDRGWSVYHVGQDAETQARALEIVRREVPGIDIDGHHGYFDQSAGSAESGAVIDGVNAAGADLLLVGFGAPRQEAWIAAHRDRIDAPAVLACGACMEYVAGAVRTPPRILGRLGLEWAFRLLENPKRFAFRYGVEPFLLAGLLVRNAVRDGVHSGPAEDAALEAAPNAGSNAGPDSRPNSGNSASVTEQ